MQIRSSLLLINLIAMYRDALFFNGRINGKSNYPWPYPVPVAVITGSFIHTSSETRVCAHMHVIGYKYPYVASYGTHATVSSVHASIDTLLV